MSMSETSESPSLQFNTDVHIKETSANMSSLKTEVVSNAINHNPHLEERLRLPDNNTGKNPGIMNGACGKSSMCFESVNGFAYNINSLEDENVSSSSKSNKCDSETKERQTCDQGLLSDCDSKSTLKTHSEKDVTRECDDTEQNAKSNSLSDDNSVEKMIKCLDNTSLIENSLVNEPEGDVIDGISYVVYESERQMPDIMRLITKDLSEPYSIYTYRYFIHNWPKLCFLTMDKDVCVGAIVCKLDLHKKMVRRGYIAMLAVDSAYRRRKLGSTLVTKAIQAMIRDDCDEVVLETEITNQAALRLYENLGFVRDKRLFRYYLNGVDALRLKLWLR